MNFCKPTNSATEFLLLIYCKYIWWSPTAFILLIIMIHNQLVCFCSQPLQPEKNNNNQKGCSYITASEWQWAICTCFGQHACQQHSAINMLINTMNLTFITASHDRAPEARNSLWIVDSKWSLVSFHSWLFAPLQVCGSHSYFIWLWSRLQIIATCKTGSAGLPSPIVKQA